MQAVQGKLTMVGLNTSAPQVFWNGEIVSGIVDIRVDWDIDEPRIKLRVNGTADELYAALAASGIIIKKGH